VRYVKEVLETKSTRLENGIIREVVKRSSGLDADED
jgi:hypothetical protein